MNRILCLNHRMLTNDFTFLIGPRETVLQLRGGVATHFLDVAKYEVEFSLSFIMSDQPNDTRTKVIKYGQELGYFTVDYDNIEYPPPTLSDEPQPFTTIPLELIVGKY